MEEAHEEEIDAAQEEGNKALWKMFYEFKDTELLEEYPDTSVDTIYRTGETLDAYMYHERVGVPPLPGGRDNQTEEWDQQIACVYSAKARAEEELELQRKLKEIDADSDDEDERPKFDEED